MKKLQGHEDTVIDQIPSLSSPEDKSDTLAGNAAESGYIHDDEYREGISVGKYIVIKELGAGSSAKVVLAFDKATERKVAIKIVKRVNSSLESKDSGESKTVDKSENDNREAWKSGFNDTRIFREVIISSLLDHPHIVKLLDFLHSSRHFFLVFEYVKGQQLYETVLKHSRVTEEQARKYFRQIISAVDYLHKNSIVHRDLKIENIIIDHNDNVKLIDFGLSNFFDNKMLLNTFCGSLYFAAPELLMGMQYNGPEVDVWSLGVILYVMLCGKVPFDDESVRELQNKIKEAQFEFIGSVSNDAKSLVMGMIVPEVEARFSINQIKRSQWINNGYSCMVENYLGKRFPLAKLSEEYVAAICSAMSFQFPTAREQIEGFYVCCKQQNEAFDSVYWLKNPVVSMYYLLAENIGSYCKTSPNTLKFRANTQSLPETLHNFVEFVFANDGRNIPTKYFTKSVFREDPRVCDGATRLHAQTATPTIKKSYLKGIFQGIKVKHIGSHNALKKILLDIFKKHAVSYEADEKGYFCSFYSNDEECYFKVSLYYNVIFSEYYLVLKCLNSKRSPFKVIYDTIQNSLKYRSK